VPRLAIAVVARLNGDLRALLSVLNDHFESTPGLFTEVRAQWLPQSRPSWRALDPLGELGWGVANVCNGALSSPST
jgi:hypothetical protein